MSEEATYRFANPVDLEAEGHLLQGRASPRPLLRRTLPGSGQPTPDPHRPHRKADEGCGSEGHGHSSGQLASCLSEHTHRPHPGQDAEAEHSEGKQRICQIGDLQRERDMQQPVGEDCDKPQPYGHPTDTPKSRRQEAISGQRDRDQARKKDRIEPFGQRRVGSSSRVQMAYRYQAGGHGQHRDVCRGAQVGRPGRVLEGARWLGLLFRSPEGPADDVAPEDPFADLPFEVTLPPGWRVGILKSAPPAVRAMAREAAFVAHDPRSSDPHFLATLRIVAEEPLEDGDAFQTEQEQDLLQELRRASPNPAGRATWRASSYRLAQHCGYATWLRSWGLPTSCPCNRLTSRSG